MLAPVTASKAAVGALKEAAALFHRDEGVVEGGRSRVIGDGFDFGELLRHAGFDCGLVVGVLDLVEGRGLEWQGAGSVEGIGGAKVGRGSVG